MTPSLRRLLLAAFAAGAALTLGGCVYYPSSYGYGYGYYAPPPDRKSVV